MQKYQIDGTITVWQLFNLTSSSHVHQTHQHLLLLIILELRLISLWLINRDLILERPEFEFQQKREKFPID